MEKTYRIFSLVSYDDSDTMAFNKINSLIPTLKTTYFIIKHDKDEVKNHYHIVLYFNKPTTISIISKKLDIQSNYIRVTDDFGKRYTLKNTIGYLIHFNNKDKYNYTTNDIMTNNVDIVNKYYDLLSGGNNENQNLKEIMLFLENNPTSNCKDLLYFCIDNDLLKTFKKYSYFLNQIIKENLVERTYI